MELLRGRATKADRPPQALRLRSRGYAAALAPPFQRGNPPVYFRLGLGVALPQSFSRRRSSSASGPRARTTCMTASIVDCGVGQRRRSLSASPIGITK